MGELEIFPLFWRPSSIIEQSRRRFRPPSTSSVPESSPISGHHYPNPQQATRSAPFQDESSREPSSATTGHETVSSVPSPPRVIFTPRLAKRKNSDLGLSNFTVQGFQFCKKLLKMQLTIEFGGGLELLCDSVKVHKVNVGVPKGAEKLTMRDLLTWVNSNLIKERPEMFIKGETVRPGVLVLVNDCDWELSGQLETTIEDKDVVVFISTLHGG